jgi:transposase
MKRIAVFVLLAILNLTCSMPGVARNKGIVRYGHQSQKEAQKDAEKQRKEYEKAVRKQQKTLEKYEKKQRRAAQKVASNATKTISHHSRSGSR